MQFEILIGAWPHQHVQVSVSGDEQRKHRTPAIGWPVSASTCARQARKAAMWVAVKVHGIVSAIEGSSVRMLLRVACLASHDLTRLMLWGAYADHPASHSNCAHYFFGLHGLSGWSCFLPAPSPPSPCLHTGCVRITGDGDEHNRVLLSQATATLRCSVCHVVHLLQCRWRDTPASSRGAGGDGP